MSNRAAFSPPPSYRGRSFRRAALTLLSLCLLLAVSFGFFAMAAAGGRSSPRTGGIASAAKTAPERRLPSLAQRREALLGKALSELPYAEDFSDAAFIGDSRTEGLMLNNSLYTADFFTGIGLMVNGADSKEIITLEDGSKGTVLEGLAQGKYRRVYLMFGINELGWQSTDAFREEYIALIEDVRRIQPGAEIFVQTIFPVSREKSDGDPVYNNRNVVRFNAEIRAAAEAAGATLLDTALLFDDGAGNLPAGDSVDGVHLTASCYRQWLDYLREAS